jgi:hypothetical protein
MFYCGIVTTYVLYYGNFTFKVRNGNMQLLYLASGTQWRSCLMALFYKPEGRGFDSRWCHWKFPLTQSFQPQYGPGVDSAFNRNECLGYFLGRKGGRCVGLTTLPLSCDDCLEIREPKPPGTLRACPGL